MSGVQVLAGDCIEVMRSLKYASVDAIVTDPPYGLEFMGREWDSFKPASARIRQPSGRDQTSGAAHNATTSLVARNAPEGYVAGQSFQQWCEAWARECLRVLKPGGHLLAFGGTRTYHRLGCAIEDAGFEVRDSLHWIYGSGFPKSLDVSKAIDKASGVEREVIGEKSEGWRPGNGSGVMNMHGRDVVNGSAPADRTVNITVAATEDAARWEGWGTALKPAHEPIILARKPLAGTVAGNVLEYGTGALNIDACRVEGVKNVPASPRRASQGPAFGDLGNDPGTGSGWDHNTGRWPPNILLTHGSACASAGQRQVRTGKAVGRNRDGSLIGNQIYGERRKDDRDAGYADPDGFEFVEAWDCAPGCPVAEMDRQSGEAKSTPFAWKASHSQRRTTMNTANDGSMEKPIEVTRGFNDSGGASRFFPVFRYQAKAKPSERPRIDGIAHPTVKPLELMRWLVRLVTPPGGIVLDPFAGTGTTGEACLEEGFRCVLIEREPEYLKLIRARLDSRQPTLFDL